MTEVAAGLWIGNTESLKGPNIAMVNGVFNVAADLSHFGDDRTALKRLSQLDAEGISYSHVGLVDGPGNEVTDYCAAVLTLKVLSRRFESVLVYDHSGGRALVVALAYLNLTGGQERAEPNAWSHWRAWDECVSLCPIEAQELATRVHRAHIEAFNKLPWGVLAIL